MKYICSATIKKLPEQPQEWLSFIASVLQLNPAQTALVKQATVFEDDEHIQASCFFRTAFDALYRLRAAQAIHIEFQPGHYIKDVSVRFTRYENTVFFFFLIDRKSVV